MNVLPIGPTPAKTMSARDGRDLILAPGLTRRCTPPEQVMVKCPDLVRAARGSRGGAEKTWGAIIGSDLFLATWAVLHSLARVTRNRTCGCQH